MWPWPTLAQREVVLVRPALVAVPLDENEVVGVGLQPSRVAVEDLGVVGADVVLVEVEEHVLEIGILGELTRTRRGAGAGAAVRARPARGHGRRSRGRARSGGVAVEGPAPGAGASAEPEGAARKRPGGGALGQPTRNRVNTSRGITKSTEPVAETWCGTSF
jgi:hypothetical protein